MCSYCFSTDIISAADENYKIEVLHKCISSQDNCSNIYCPCRNCSKYQKAPNDYTEGLPEIPDDTIIHILSFLPQIIQQKAKCLCRSMSTIVINKNMNMLMPGNYVFNDILALTLAKTRKDQPDGKQKLLEIAKLRTFREYPELFNNIIKGKIKF